MTSLYETMLINQRREPENKLAAQKSFTLREIANSTQKIVDDLPFKNQKMLLLKYLFEITPRLILDVTVNA